MSTAPQSTIQRNRNKRLGLCGCGKPRTVNPDGTISKCCDACKEKAKERYHRMRQTLTVRIPGEVFKVELKIDPEIVTEWREFSSTFGMSLTEAVVDAMELYIETTRKAEIAERARLMDEEEQGYELKAG